MIWCGEGKEHVSNNVCSITLHAGYNTALAFVVALPTPGPASGAGSQAPQSV
jgi:hypothetical protein